MTEQFPVDVESALTATQELKAQKAEAEAELKKCLEMLAQAEASLVKYREIPDDDKDKHIATLFLNAGQASIDAFALSIDIIREDIEIYDARITEILHRFPEARCDH